MSTAKFNTWLNPDGTENYKCRAWVNFNGTGTVAIRASGNVTSITDSGTGLYTVNFTTAMPDANYVADITGSVDKQSLLFQYFAGISADNGTTTLKTTTQITVISLNYSASFVDSSQMNVAIFR